MISARQIIACAAIPLTLVAFGDVADLDPVFERVDRAWNACCNATEYPLTITWTGEKEFVYTTIPTAGTPMFRRVNVEKQTMDAISHADFQKATKDRVEEQTIGDQIGARIEQMASCDGTLAFVRNGNIWIKTNVGRTYQLSSDGTAACPYQHLMWSPDGRYLAALKKENLGKRHLRLRDSHPGGSIYARFKTVDYEVPGDRRAQAYPALFSLEDGKQIPLDLSMFGNQFEVLLECWPTNDTFTFSYNARGNQEYSLVAVDVPSGNVRVLAREVSDTFVYWPRVSRKFIHGGRDLIWTSYRSGWRHIYMYETATGVCRQMTDGDWNVRDILLIDESNDQLYCMANGVFAGKGEDPYNQHLVRLDLKTGESFDLTPENGNHVVRLNAEGTLFTDSMSRPDLVPISTVRETYAGNVVYAFPEMNVDSIRNSPDYPKVEVFHAKARDGVTDIWGEIWRPADFDPEKKYPVVEDIYAGPHTSHVEKNFHRGNPRGIQLLEDGYVVVSIDAMGTSFRSKAFRDVCWRNLKDAGFEDRILWLKAAAKDRPWMDLSRVGIYGYSAGGQNAMGALLFHDDFYKAAVALNGCHDNRLGLLWWNEQFMGYPVGPWYAESSNVVNANKLKRPLLLVCGEMDDNVDTVATLQVVDALLKANKDFEQLYLPGYQHDLANPYVDRRILDFFNRKLK